MADTRVTLPGFSAETLFNIRNIPDRPDSDCDSWSAREGIVVVPKNATIPAGTVI